MVMPSRNAYYRVIDIGILIFLVTVPTFCITTYTVSWMENVLPRAHVMEVS